MLMYWSHSSSQIVEELQASEKLWQEAVGFVAAYDDKHGESMSKPMLHSNGFSLLQDEEHVLQTWETKNFPSLAQTGPSLAILNLEPL